MIINKVSIQNFFCYLGDNNQLDFAKGLNIISASNGGGKSQLFNAFYWTFFDRVYVDKEGHTGKKEWKTSNNIVVCPDKLMIDCLEGQTINSSVVVSLSSEFHENSDLENEKVEYTFTKSVIYKKTGDEFIQISKAELTIYYEKDGETEYIPTHQHSMVLEKIFPSSIRKFMWYQGETMDNLYDFSNNITLRNAINEISYYPMYDVMEKIVLSSSKSIDDKIEKELAKHNKLGNQEQALFRDISDSQRNIETKESQIQSLNFEIADLEDDMAELDDKLKGFDEFVQIKTSMVQHEADIKILTEKLENIDILSKESLINTWMLNGCDKLIEAARPNLELLNAEIQRFQATKNPVPVSLPGPEYVEKMLADHMCYICEREVEEDTAPYEALKRRLFDFEQNSNYRVLQDNYTELNRSRARLIRELPGIAEEIKNSDLERRALLKKKNAISKKLRGIFEEVGDDQRENVLKGALSATQLGQKLQTVRSEIARKTKTRDYISGEVLRARETLKEKQALKDAIVKKSDTNLVESEAAEYINMFVISIGMLRGIAYERLIDEIQRESNRLYSLYLGNKQQGRIEIGDGIRIVDEETGEVLTNLNTGELVAQKLAVANSFLSLSAKKLNKRYPILADAPTSELDSENTYNLTVNIGKSFEQIIIMSKDYASFSADRIAKLIDDAEIVKFYKIENNKIDQEGPNSRTNKRSFISTIK